MATYTYPSTNPLARANPLCSVPPTTSCARPLGSAWRNGNSAVPRPTSPPPRSDTPTPVRAWAGQTVPQGLCLPECAVQGLAVPEPGACRPSRCSQALTPLRGRRSGAAHPARVAAGALIPLPRLTQS